jgi:integrase
LAPQNRPLIEAFVLTEAFFRSPKVGEWTDGDGLILVVRNSSRANRLRKSWILRATVAGKRRKIGLGSCGLAEARKRAQDARQRIAEGKDPSQRARARLQASIAFRSMTFAEAVELWLPKAPRFKNPKSELIRQRALMRLTPLNAKPLTAITPADLAKILHGLSSETALRVYSTARNVFAFGAVLLEAENIVIRSPADLARLKALGWSPRSRRLCKPLPALHWSRAPELLDVLERDPDPIALLLRFVLATASRCGPVRLAKRKSINLKARTWTIPVEDLKDSPYRREPFIVPLNDTAIAALSTATSEWLFADDRGQPFTDWDITGAISRLRRRRPDWVDPSTSLGFTAHGFRSMFRSWAAARHEPREMVEIAMGHRVYGQVEGAYQRDDLFEVRAGLMQRWADHCRGRSAEVIPLLRA